MAISTHPSYATAHENLGDIYAKMASQAYDKALQLDKGNVTAQTKLSLVKELFSASGKVNRAPAKSEAPKAASAPAPSVPAVAPAKPEPTKPVPAPVVTPAPAPAKPEAVKPAPEVKPAPAPAESKVDAEAAVLKTLNNWANAWSGKNVSDYLGHYARDFKVPGGESRAAWEKGRKTRIGKAKSIQVAIESPRVTFSDASHASITFRQAYKSDALSTSTQKTIVLVKSGDKWLIQQERIGR
jgi:ketosteroid isomerase-like protein